MQIPILEACRKRKRRPKIFSFQTFGNPGCPINPSGPFRDNVRLFLHDCAEPEDYDVDGMPVWCTLLVHNTDDNVVVPLYTIQEDAKTSPRNPFCDLCRSSGWRNRLVSKRKYHILIPADRMWHRPLDGDVLDVQTHLLHGLIHCDGYGHLISINGIEAGSKLLCGRETMDLWDRICTFLHAREVTIEDVSMKRSMDLRLLYGVAYGHSWFGRWDYRFCRGSFGVTLDNYERAIQILSSVELDKMIEDFYDSDQCKMIEQIISHYRDLSESQLVTIRDLLRFMLTLKSLVPVEKKSVAMSRPTTRMPLQNKHSLKERSPKYKKLRTLIASMDSRWPSRRLEFTAQVIVDILKEHREDNLCLGGMTRQDVRDAARLHIGDTGLLDYVLKSMNNVIVGNHVVCRAVNPTTRILEYSIKRLDDPGQTDEPRPPSNLSKSVNLAPGADVYGDVVCLYTNLLINYPQSEVISLATQVVLDSKLFIKEWPVRDEDDQFLRFICRVVPSLKELETDLTKELPLSELVVIPLYATIGELKAAAEMALRDTYCVLEDFVVNEVEEMKGKEDEEVLFGAAESGSVISVRGFGVDLSSNLKYEGGTENWKVKCECGAVDDDGERMVACDMCGVWQHTVCRGIEDSEAVPSLFFCNGCGTSLGETVSESGFEYTHHENAIFMHPYSEYGMDLLA